ncbi:hypothetical protein [Agromyces sp. NPDC058064]|uniref:hypothetical protein n=1 Tax=Agromyces sp. NPDC058064 TaxID=3346322 RepID=UPI0036DAFE36
MNGVSLLQIVREQFFSEAPPAIAKPGIAWLQLFWLLAAAIVGGIYATSASLAGDEAGTGDPGAAVLAANAVFTALSVTMAMFFWPRAINLKNDPKFSKTDERWHVYRLTTQLFWTVLVGILATGLAVLQLAIPATLGAFATGIDLPGNLDTLRTSIEAVSIALTSYQVLLLGQSVFRLYAATYWMPRA